MAAMFPPVYTSESQLTKNTIMQITPADNSNPGSNGATRRRNRASVRHRSRRMARIGCRFRLLLK